MRVKGIVSYDGSHYQGFQDQKKDNINPKTKAKESVSLVCHFNIRYLVLFLLGSYPLASIELKV